jgi:hypothetical protein
MNQNHSKNEPSESRRKKLQICVEILTRWFAKWSAVFPNHPVSKLQTATYAEALGDLTAEQLEYGCKYASREMEQFPKPGHIRAHAEKFNPNREYLGPPLEWNPELEHERLERKAQWERQLADSKAMKTIKPLDDQKRELREKGWLQ